MDRGGFSHTRVKRLTDQVNVFDFDKVIPCNLNNSHWAVSVVETKKKWTELLNLFYYEQHIKQQLLNSLRWTINSLVYYE